MIKHRAWRVADKRTLQGNFMIMPIGSGGAVARVYDEANAQLIVSVPDLYEALVYARTILNLARDNYTGLTTELLNSVISDSDKALAKAEGK